MQEAFVLSPADRSLGHLAIFTTHLRQATTFFTMHLPGSARQWHRNSYGKFYMREWN
jgi:hypothetical protein